TCPPSFGALVSSVGVALRLRPAVQHLLSETGCGRSRRREVNRIALNRDHRRRFRRDSCIDLSIETRQIVKVDWHFFRPPASAYAREQNLFAASKVDYEGRLRQCRREVVMQSFHRLAMRGIARQPRIRE